jgi:ABC-2 type transport system ATP-binding protein
MADAITVEGLRKDYGGFEAVKGIDLSIREGEIFAFLGPNGAGKTTTIEILEGFRTATSGQVRVLGVAPAPPLAWREKIGIVLQQSQVEKELTPREAVTMFAAYYQGPRLVDEVIELVGLADKANDRIGKLSGGQQRRLDLALALIGDPKLIFLDEPTTGFDPSARRESWEMIDNLRSIGCTVMLTTHYMDEAQQLSDRIAVIADGRIVARGTAAELGQQVQARPTISWRGATVPTLSDRVAVRADEGHVRVETTEDDLVGVVREITDWATDHDDSLHGFEITRPDLEQTYLRLIEAGFASPDEVAS